MFDDICRTTAPGSPQAGAAVRTIDVDSRTIQPGDVLTMGGMAYQVLNLIQLRGQGKAVRFTTGEVLNIHSHTRLTVTRPTRRR